jgi:predicted Zn-dependent protease
VARAVFLNRYETAVKALAEIDAARRLDPDNPATSNLRATILLAADRPREAEADIREALRREPGYANHSLVLAQALLSQKRPDEATEVLRALKRREPDNIGAAYQLGLLALEKNDLAEATAQMEFVTRRDAQYENALWHLVSLYRRQDRVQESRPLAALYGRMKRNAETFTATLSRMDERPGDLKTHWQMAGLRMGADEFPQAIVELRAILQFQPDDPDVRRNLITALNRSGRATEARQLAAAAAAGAASKTAAAPGRR